MEKTIDELKRAVPFKETTEPGDVVLMVREVDNQEAPFAVAYARILGFERDVSKRDEWWFVSLTFLTVPPQSQVLILETSQITGQEVFTMGGKKVFIKAVDFSRLEPGPPGTEEKPAEEEPSPKTDQDRKDKKRGGLRIVKS